MTSAALAALTDDQNDVFMALADAHGLTAAASYATGLLNLDTAAALAANYLYVTEDAVFTFLLHYFTSPDAPPRQVADTFGTGYLGAVRAYLDQPVKVEDLTFYRSR